MQSAFISFIFHHIKHQTIPTWLETEAQNYRLFIMSGLTLFSPQPGTSSIVNASTVCIRPEEREGGSWLCRHIKATSVRYGNMPCRTSLFTATPGWMLKPAAVLYIHCGEILMFGGILLSLFKLLSMCVDKWEVLLKRDHCYCSIAAYYSFSWLLFWVVLVILRHWAIRVHIWDSKVHRAAGLFIMLSNFWAR